MLSPSSSSAQVVRGLPALWDADRFGVLASVLCAIHCAATPFLLLILPTFGKVWAHPASHWLMALIVVPIALVMVSKGYQRHRRKWTIAIGFLGVFFVLIGAVAPYFEKADAAKEQPQTVVTSNDSSQSHGGASCDSESSCGEGLSCQEMANEEGLVVKEAASGCVDSCCPSLIVEADGSKSLHIPLASILTTIGGLFLIVTHIGNLCKCSCCKKQEQAPQLAAN